MNGIIIVIGFTFPYEQADKAIQWAKENAASLKGLFLTTEKVPEDSYPFPNDMKAAEKPEKEVLAADAIAEVQLARDEWKYLQNRASNEAINIDNEFLENPSLDVVLDKCGDAKKVFVQISQDNSELMLEGFRFNGNHLVERLIDSGFEVN